MPNEIQDVLIENARILFRNFAGKEDKYNRAGDRNFCIVLDEETADDLEAAGWNVKRRPPKEEGDDPFNYIHVAVSFKGRPPRVALVTSRNRTTLEEEDVEMLDWVDIKNVDVKFSPYKWTVNGRTGVKAYLQTIYVTIIEDELDLKYEHLPEVGKRNVRALPAGGMNDGALDDEILDAEVLNEYEEDDAPKAPPRGRGK